jgi:hypothetical protein
MSINPVSQLVGTLQAKDPHHPKEDKTPKPWKIFYLNRDTYEGGLLEGKKHGFGIYTHASGRIFRGNWVANQRHGHGTQNYVTCEYSGNFLNDQKDGLGVFTWENGDSYTGEWKLNKIHGQGILRWASGGECEGQWDCGKPVYSGMTLKKTPPLPHK